MQCINRTCLAITSIIILKQHNQSTLLLKTRSRTKCLPITETETCRFAPGGWTFLGVFQGEDSDRDRVGQLYVRNAQPSAKGPTPYQEVRRQRKIVGIVCRRTAERPWAIMFDPQCPNEKHVDYRDWPALLWSADVLWAFKKGSGCLLFCCFSIFCLLTTRWCWAQSFMGVRPKWLSWLM